MRQFDIAVVIGRFQPFHNGHKFLLDKALALGDRVVVLVGSANVAVNIKNPFTFTERKEMIESVFACPDAQTTFEKNTCPASRVVVKPVKDYINDELWVQEIQRIVEDEADGTTRRIVLVGHSKDDSTYYLKMFPQWKYQEIPHNDKLNATDIRELLYDKKSIKYLHGVVPESVYKYIETDLVGDKFDLLREEYLYIQDYLKSWAGSPYDPSHYTSDAVVIQQGHILLVKRGEAPGKDLWALPGGFVERQEVSSDAYVRELIEETGLKVPEKVIRGSTKSREIFDNPNRSLRGRVITVAYLVHLTYIDQGLPHIKAGSDAKEARWVPLSEVREEEMFEDHYHIIQTMIGRL